MNNFTPPITTTPTVDIPLPVVQITRGGWSDTSDDEPEDCAEHGD
jgi:hypothetical protein